MRKKAQKKKKKEGQKRKKKAKNCLQGSAQKSAVLEIKRRDGNKGT